MKKQTIKEYKEVILHDLGMLRDTQDADKEYHYLLCKGNIRDIFKKIESTL